VAETILRRKISRKPHLWGLKNVVAGKKGGEGEDKISLPFPVKRS
jgi:hypothetical protein